MKVVIVDDEPIMLLAMKRMLSSMEEVELVGSFQNATEASDFIETHPVDLVFLDIQIATDDGIELARHLRLTQSELDIVFTTSHSDYAMAAYDVYPLDYMVKPIGRERLNQTIIRAMQRRNLSSNASASNQLVDANQSRLTVRALGCLETSSEQHGIVKWTSKKSEELFVYLILHRGQSVAKMRIIEDLFPDKDYKKGEVYLHTVVYQLRKVLHPHGFKEILISGQERYRIEMSQLDVDFIQFEQELDKLADITDDNVAKAIELEKQFSGELFEEQSFVWAVLEREKMNVLYQTFTNHLANWLVARERYGEVIQIARKLVARNEFDERSNQLLLTALGAMGDKQSFHSYYERYVQLLQGELRLQPSSAIQKIHRQYR